MSSPVTPRQTVMPRMRQDDVFSREYPHRFQMADALAAMTYGEFIDIAGRLALILASGKKPDQALWQLAMEIKRGRQSDHQDSMSDMYDIDELPSIVSDRRS